MAFSNKQELAQKALRLISDKQAPGRGIGLAAIEDLVDVTVAWLSKYDPRWVTDTLSGDGSAYQFALSGLDPSWVNGFSYLDWVEYPVESTQQQVRQFLDPSDYELFPKPAAPTHLHFSGVTPASGTDNIRICYPVLHTIDDSSSTVADHREPGFEFGLAHVACKAQATNFAYTTDSTIESDAVDYATKPQTWLELARVFLEEAGQVFGVDLTAPPGEDGAGVRPVSHWVEYDPLPTHLVRSTDYR